MPDEFSTHNPQQHEEHAHVTNRISGDLESTVMRAVEREPGMFGVSIFDYVTGTWSVSEESFTFDQVSAMCVAYVGEGQYMRMTRLDKSTAVYQPQWIHPLVGQEVTAEAA